MNPKLLLGTSNLIKKLGDEVKIITQYELIEDVYPESDILTLYETYGIKENSTFSLGSEKNLIVKYREDNTVKLLKSVERFHLKGTYLINETITKGIPVPRFKRITYELLEFLRKIRVPGDTTTNYGSIVSHFDETFFVVGIDPGDASYSLTLREINTNINIYRDDFVRQPGAWGGESFDITVYSDIPAYFQHNKAELNLRNDLGYVPQGDAMMLVPKELKLTIGDLVISNSGYPLNPENPNQNKYLVAGLDRFTHKNLLSVVLSYESK